MVETSIEHTGGATQCTRGRTVIITEPSFGERVARRDAKQYANYKDLLADENVEAVVIATPSHQHKEIVQDALKAGKHVYCEAPWPAPSKMPKPLPWQLTSIPNSISKRACSSQRSAT